MNIWVPGQKLLGNFKLHEFNQDDDEMFLEINWENQTDFDLMVGAKRILENEMTQKMRITFCELQKAMKEKDADEMSKKRDKLEREQAQ